jgi:hypothetical protein
MREENAVCARTCARTWTRAAVDGRPPMHTNNPCYRTMALQVAAQSTSISGGVGLVNASTFGDTAAA